MDGGFDFTQHMRRLCASLAVELDELAHLDVDRIAIRFCQARKAVPHGVLATLTPLRFEHGALARRMRGRLWTIERLYDARGREMLYLLSFYLPRFLERPLEDKLTTVVHELWHVSPAFDGDLRRHAGRCWAHTRSQADFDAHARGLALRWLGSSADTQSCDFLRSSFRQLAQQHGRIVGQRIRTPRLLPASDAGAASLAS